MRGIALAASVTVVLVQWDGRGAWFWVGVALVVLNVSGLLAARSRPGRGEPPSQTDGPGAFLSLGDGGDGQSHRLDGLLSVPGVAAAFAAGPPLWRQVSYLDDTRFEPTTAEELAAFVWIEEDDGWEIGLGDEVKPYVDLDLDEDDDPVIHVLRSHPAVAGAFHEDREVYRAEFRSPVGLHEFAALAARALVSHHVHATRS